MSRIAVSGNPILGILFEAHTIATDLLRAPTEAASRYRDSERTANPLLGSN